MNIAQLEHVLRAAAAITGTDRFVVIGSQSILGTIADPPTDLTQSVEVDLAPLSTPSDPISLMDRLASSRLFIQHSAITPTG